MTESNMGKWDAWYSDLNPLNPTAFRYSDTATYKIAEKFLANMEVIEDWGCGAGGFKNYRTIGYVGVDGSHTPFADKIVDLCDYATEVDGVLLRHVLEHNYEWEKVLRNAVKSANKKLCLIIFTPFVEDTKEIAHNLAHGVDVPDISFSKESIENCFEGCEFVLLENILTNTGYGVEHVYMVTKKHE